MSQEQSSRNINLHEPIDNDTIQADAIKKQLASADITCNEQVQRSGNITIGKALEATALTDAIKKQLASADITCNEQVQRSGNITIGEALEATALTAGHRPVDYSDAAAIQAAEVRATGRTNIVPGGVAAAAQSAATRNARLQRDEDKTKLREILSDASTKLPSDKAVTRRDAEGVIGAELRNDPNLCTRPGGVAASLAAAARLNHSNISSTNTSTTTPTPINNNL